jgi:redox-sensing transcriptional repressor
MTSSPRASDASMLRLSRYHCFLGAALDSDNPRRVTSRELATQLGLSEETVRHDLKHVPIEGRPGAGYDATALHDALTEYLDLSEGHPFLVVGNVDMLRGLTVTFPAAQFGMRPVGYLSDRPEDAGVDVDGITVSQMSEAPRLVEEFEVSLALVACAPEAVDSVLERLLAAGVSGVLMLTPVLRPHHPEGLHVTYFRMPCALKSLAAKESPTQDSTPSCCG